MKKFYNYPALLLSKAISRFLYKHPAILFATQRCALRVVSRRLDFATAFQQLKRPEWVSVPGIERSFCLDFEIAGARTDAEVTLAKRIVDSYPRTVVDGKVDSGVGKDTIWKILSDRSYSRMLSIVLSGDPVAVADFFSRVFQSEAVDGFAMGTWYDSSPHRWWLWGAGVVTSIVSLAEACGLVRAECPEQGQIGYALSGDGLEGVLEKLDRHFGFRIESPRIGSARGISVDGRFISRETCSQLYTAERIRQAFDAQVSENAPMHIIEIGGGYGGLCYWLLKLCGNRIKNYYIVDLPATGLVQSYFLGSILNEGIEMYGARNEGARVVLVPHFALNSISSPINIMVNQDSMPEMPSSEVMRYLSWGARHLDGVFLSFNQEAFSIVNGTPQLLVPEYIASYPTYRRISRNTAWDRRGYVEEVYVNDPVESDEIK